jgi:hypothetical protein
MSVRIMLSLNACQILLLLWHSQYVSFFPVSGLHCLKWEHSLSGSFTEPLYKNKGDKLDPSNFRPITIISCFGKLFTSLLNTRLNKFSEDYCLICENQGGFRKGYSTTDNLFVIYMLISIMKNKKKKLYCAFIDFAKAFDTIWRKGLWHKLFGNEINGKMYKVIFNMYSGIKI